MLKKPASIVLASFRSSTGTQPPHRSTARTNVVLLIRRTVRPRGYASVAELATALAGARRVLARRGRAGEKSGLFEHAGGSNLIVDGKGIFQYRTDPYGLSAAV